MLKPQEAAVAHALADAWNAFLKLPVEHNDDIDEFRRAIHAAQNIVLSRPGRREINAVDRAADAIIRTAIADCLNSGEVSEYDAQLVTALLRTGEVMDAEAAEMGGQPPDRTEGA